MGIRAKKKKRGGGKTETNRRRKQEKARDFYEASTRIFIGRFK